MPRLFVPQCACFWRVSESVVNKSKPKGHKGLKRRLKVTAGGKILRRRAGKSHLMSGKSGKQVRQLRRWRGLSPGDQRLIKRQYGVS